MPAGISFTRLTLHFQANAGRKWFFKEEVMVRFPGGTTPYTNKPGRTVLKVLDRSSNNAALLLAWRNWNFLPPFSSDLSKP